MQLPKTKKIETLKRVRFLGDQPWVLPGLLRPEPTLKFLVAGDQNRALYRIRTEADAENAFVDMMTVYDLSQGLIGPGNVPSAHHHFRRIYRKMMASKTVAEVATRCGFPADIRRLFAASRKKDQEKICRTLSLTSGDLFNAIDNANAEGWSYRSGHRDHVPKEAQIPPGIDGLMRIRGEPKAPIAGQQRAAFESRKRASWHFFERDGVWHCFWFSDRDVVGDFDGKLHWEHGSHVHYTSSAFGISKDRLFAELGSRSTNVRHEYIRFEAL